MKQNLISNKAYTKTSQNRMRFRQQLFEKNRNQTQLQRRSYLNDYDKQTRQTILNSIYGPIPSSLLPVSQAVRSTISYYTRQDTFVYKLRLSQKQDEPIDLHMAYQSLVCLANIDNLDVLTQAQRKRILSTFTKDFPILMAISNKQIQQVALYAAGNHCLAEPEDILQALKQQPQDKWILVNYVLEGKIDAKLLLQELQNNNKQIYRCLAQISDNKNSQIIYPLISVQKYVNIIMNNVMNNDGSENSLKIKQYSIRIIGNILAQAEDYGGDLTKWNILQKIFNIIGNNKQQERRTGCWLLANFTAEQPGAKQLLTKKHVMQRLFIMHKSQKSQLLRLQLNIILVHLFSINDKNYKKQLYKIALQQQLLQQCSTDLQAFQKDLVMYALHLISLIIQIGDYFCNNSFSQSIDTTGQQIQQSQLDTNQFLDYVKSNCCEIKSRIMSKTYSQHAEISEISCAIADKFENQSNNDYF